MDLSHRFYLNVNRYAHTGPWQDCWEWTGKLNSDGYAENRIRSFGRSVRAYQFAYEMIHGKVPAGHEVNHRCNHRSCVNPDHLEAITTAGNHAYREILRRLGYVPRPQDLPAAIAKHAAIEATIPRMPTLDKSRYVGAIQSL